MTRRFFRAGDLGVLLGALLLVFAFYFFFGFYSQNAGDTVYIYADGALYDTVALGDAPDTPYTVTTARGELTLLFSETGVEAVAASCPDAVCVRTGRIHRTGESIICAPLGICITLGESSLDGVTG